ncbi:MAG TPA: ORF6N domain-containing protein [Candidatus Udaeobacter sp.]|jgi:phage regulator Rha-like protein|nr:ORF6N domain-containing protein [Candidatus Udaeobacter sp.]
MICLNQFDQIMTLHRKIANLEGAIHLIRGQRVMLDSDLATIYSVTTKRLNEQLRRNRSRFPSDFAFQLTTEELTNLRSQIATSSFHGGRRYRPWVFTEHGALMLANVLNSAIAVQASVRVVRAFVRLREMVAANAQLAAKLKELERRFDSHDEAIANLFAALKQLVEPTDAPKRREIGFHVREEGVRYRVRKAPRIKNRNSRIS